MPRPLEYEDIGGPGKHGLSALAVAVFALGCLFVLPIQVWAAMRFGLDETPAEVVAFAPPAAVMVMALGTIVWLRRRPKLGGLGFAVAAFWLGLGGTVTAGILLSGGLFAGMGG
ncbi:MAG TPA: hypothetical protein VEA69_06125 [Tepidisphaeraceae bacterium]|nr:hypothetical protein [Tepidisphaeraceae bacterium]